MMSSQAFAGYLTRFPGFAGGLYIVLVSGFCLTAVLAMHDIGQRYRTRNDSLELLNTLQNRTRGNSFELASSQPLQNTSLFLEGPTTTLASAALLHRIAGAITRVGGSVVSTEIIPQGPDAKDGYLRATATCELEEATLQQLLYDIEAETPFLFIEQMLVQLPMSAERDRLRVVLTVSALWMAKE